MSKVVQVHQYTRHKKGKTEIVHSYSASRKEGADALMRLKALLLRKVTDNRLAQEIWAKYKQYPMNLKVMLNAHWNDVTITDNHGNKHKTKRIAINNEQWARLLRENGGLAYKIIKRYNFKPEIFDDLRAVSRKAIFDAVNNYHSKYNPSNPPDLQRALAVQIRGYVQAEMSKQLAVAVNLPYNKKVLFSKFKHYYDLYDGDYAKIAEAMQIKKKDLYPDLQKIDPQEANKLLPTDGYVSLTKKDVLDKKLIEHNEYVKQLAKTFEEDITALETKREGSMDGEETAAYAKGMKLLEARVEQSSTKLVDASKQYYGRLADLESKIDSARDSITIEEKLIAKDKKYSNKRLLAFLAIQQKLADTLAVARKDDGLNKMREQLKAQKHDLESYTFEMKPIDEEEFQNEKARLANQYNDKLKEAKNKFDTEVGKTVIPGTQKLFEQFEELMSFKTMRLSDTYDDEGEDFNLEEKVPAAYLTVDKVMEITEEYAKERDKLNDALEMLSPQNEHIMRLYLGLAPENKMQPNGLWGYPMNISEVVVNTPVEIFEGGKARHKEKLALWEAKKPEQIIKTKITPQAQKLLLREWDKKRLKAKNTLKKLMKTDPKYKTLNAAKATAYREIVYAKFDVGTGTKPWNRFVEKKLSTAQYAKKLGEWKALKPKNEISEQDKYLKVRRTLEISKQALRRLLKPADIKRLLQLHNLMRENGLRMDIVKAGVDFEPLIKEVFTEIFELSFIV